MQRKKIVAGNWKMNLHLDEVNTLVESIVQMTFENNSVRKLFFPSFPYLKTVNEIIQKSKRSDFFLGSQNCHQEEKGAFTGEVSVAALRDVGCEYVLIGHSERRAYYLETNLLLRQKINVALKNNLIPVFCVGEPLEIRKEEKQNEFVKTQLIETLESFESGFLSNIVIAYEPIWAIGTGETATANQAQEMHEHIRRVLAELFDNSFAAKISILYGGSCNPGNAKEIFSCPDVDGGLIGGASLKASDFFSIIESF